MRSIKNTTELIFVRKNVSGKVFVCKEGLSFWGGVDPVTGSIIDVHHPAHGESLAGKIVLLPASRGSCSGSGVIVQLARNSRAPAALVFLEEESILTLGSIIAKMLFGRNIAILRVTRDTYHALAKAKTAKLSNKTLFFSRHRVKLKEPDLNSLKLSKKDRDMLMGSYGPAPQIAMQTICLIAAVQGANDLINVSRAHIDGCILAHDANLEFAEKMYHLGAKTVIPTTINSISVDREEWRSKDSIPNFENKACRLADAYVGMGAEPTFTCAPYLLEDLPSRGEAIGWSESNAVIFANSILGARTQKLPDYLDLFVAITGRVPRSGVYLAENRIPDCEVYVRLPNEFDDSLWAMIGWLTGAKSPNGIPLITGLESLSPSFDNLKALCAAFGTTSAAPMLQIRGHTPDSSVRSSSLSKTFEISIEELLQLWKNFNTGRIQVDLVAIGSPHASCSECLTFLEHLDGKACNKATKTIVTLGREQLAKAEQQNILKRLSNAGVQVVKDICWCSISEPIFPLDTSVIMTNSGKYAHYGKGLTGRDIRFGSLRDCAIASYSGLARSEAPRWLLQK